MRESMARLTPLFSTNRVVRQYTEEHYLSAASACKDRAANQGALGAALLNWQSQLAKHGPMVRFGSAALEHKDGQYLFQVQVFLNELDPDAVSAELYAEEKDGTAVLRQSMQRGERLVGSENGFMYTATIPATRPAADFTPRLVPQHSGALVPLEASFILWHDSPSWR
jgi:starch phosphorylase